LCLVCLLIPGVYGLNEAYAEKNNPVDQRMTAITAKHVVRNFKPLYLSEIELGGGYSSENSFKFGEYSGLKNRDGFVVGNIYLQERDKSDSTKYWKINGRNLGLESRSIRGDYGWQGKGGAFFSFNQTPHYRWDDAKTPFIIDSNTYNLPFDWVPGRDTTEMTQLNSSLKPIGIATKREKYQFGANWNFNKQWSAKIQYYYEKKNGLDVTSGIFGTSSGLGFSSILPRPVNQATNDVSAELSYNNLKSQFSVRYHLSHFDNNLYGLTWQNPYSLTPSAYPDSGRMSLEPDNQAHQVSLNFGHRLNNTTRLAGIFSYGWMLQNQNLLPYTVNPNLLVGTQLPQKSLDAEANNIHGNLTFTSRPIKNSDIKARYIFTERDNQTPMSLYTILRNDSENQDNNPNSALNRFNLPYGYRRHKLQFDAGYRLFSMTKLEAGYDFERYERDYAEVANTNEHTGRIKLTANPFHFLNARLEYAHSRRDGSAYRDNQLFIDSHTQDFLTTLPIEQRFSNNPALRRFQYSDRVRNKMTAGFTIVPTDKITMGVTSYYTHDDYNATFGLSQQERFSGTFDINYAFSDRLNVHSFYTQEYFLSKQNSFSFGNRLSAIPPLNQNNLWWLDNQDNVYTVGTGLNWIIIENKLDIELNYLFSKAVTDIDPKRTNPEAIPFPNINTDIHSLFVSSNYRLKENMRLRFSYRFESFQTKDFARDNVDPGTITQVISLGASSPDYRAHVAGVSMILNF